MNLQLIITSCVVLAIFGELHAETKEQPVGFMLRATPEMRVVPLRGKRSAYVPPVKGVDATLVFAEWADLQPEKFGSIQDENVVDRALIAIREWNRKNPTDTVRLRLRMFSGIYAPDWVMKHAGSVMVDYRKKQSARAVVRATPQFWTSAYQEAWSDFQKKMAARYDAEPLICDVSISGSMTLHTEVMWRQPGFPWVLPALMKAGLTRDNDLACLKADITRFMEIWKKTSVEMTFNSRRNYVLVNGSLKAKKADLKFTEVLLNHIATEGKRLQKSYMIGNHSLSEYSAITHHKHEDKSHVFYALKQDHDVRNTRIYFQTEVHSANIAEELICEGLKMGASLIELPNDITPEQISSPRMQSLRANLKSNHQ